MERSAVSNMTFIFMNAATSMPTENITLENTLDKFRMDMAKQIRKLKMKTLKHIRNLENEIASRLKAAKEESGAAGGSRDESETLESDTSPTSDEGVVESAAAVPKKNSRKTGTVKSKAADAGKDKDANNSRPVQTAKSDELLGKSVKTTDETKGKLKTATKKEPKAIKEKARETEKKKKSKLQRTTKATAKKETSKLKRKSKATAKKETSKLKRKSKAVSKKDKKK